MDFFSEAIQNKDFFTTIWTTGIFVIFLTIHNKVSKDLKETMEAGFSKISLGIGKKVIDDPYMLLSIGEKTVYSATTPKLNFLRRRLVQNDIRNNRNIIEKHIRTTLILMSKKHYIDFLNEFNTPVGAFGDWVGHNFKMDDFIAEIYKVFFNEDLGIDRKVELFESIMQDFQNELWDDLRIVLKI